MKSKTNVINNCLKNVQRSVPSNSNCESKPPRPPDSRPQKRAQLQEIFTKKADTVVCFQNQNISKVNWSEIEKYEKYLGFDFSHNNIQLTMDLCSAFKFIRFLNLSYNNLHTLPQDIHLMENLAVLDVAHNQISKLPMSICQMVKLEWLDIRHNPVLKTWNERKGYTDEEFDPQQFTFEIRSFLKAARDWRDYNLKARAQELSEFLTVCPPQQPFPEDAAYDLSPQDHSACPLYKMAEASPEDLKRLVNTLENSVRSKFVPEEYLITFWNSKFRRVTSEVIYILMWILLVAYAFSAAFLETNELRSFLEEFSFPDSAVFLFVRGHKRILGFFSVLQSYNPWRQYTPPQWLIDSNQVLDNYFRRQQSDQELNAKLYQLLQVMG